MRTKQLSEDDVSERKEFLLSIGIKPDNIDRLKRQLVPIESAKATVSVLKKMVSDPIPFLNQHIWAIEIGPSFLSDNLAVFKAMLNGYGVSCNIKGFYECNVKILTINPERLLELGDIAWDYGKADRFMERLHYLITNSKSAVDAYHERRDGEAFKDLVGRVKAAKQQQLVERSRRDNPELSHKVFSLTQPIKRERIEMEMTAMTTKDPLTIRRLITYGDKALVQIIKDRGLYPRTEKDGV